ncbi:MAG: 2-phospho-L-lactate guanylyltransferase, partial [Pseudomonadota bacterium]
MACWAIIPVKRFGSAKSRLADLCDVDERARLAEAMLADTLTTVCAAKGLSGIALVTADDKAATLGRQAGAIVLPDNTADLNSALTQIREQVRSKVGKVALLTLPIDLPALAVEDVEAIIETGRDATSVVVVPDHDREGTNAL